MWIRISTMHQLGKIKIIFKEEEYTTYAISKQLPGKYRGIKSPTDGHYVETDQLGGNQRLNKCKT